MALEVGIVGPSGGGKTALFTALTKTGGGEYGKTNVGMAPIADVRLGALAEVVKARKLEDAEIELGVLDFDQGFANLFYGRHGLQRGSARRPANLRFNIGRLFRID